MPTLSAELMAALKAVEVFVPYSSSSDYRAWQLALRGIEEVGAVLEMIESYKPGILKALEVASYEELQVVHDEPLPEITALVGRYTVKREPMR